MNIQRLKNTIEELKLLGIEGTFYRILYEAKNRTGFKRRLEPVEKNAAEKWQRHLISDVNIDAACLNEWIRQASPFLIYKSTDYTYYLSNIKGVKPDQIIENAGEAAVGNIKTFSKQFRSYGNPKQWHLNPVRNKYCSFLFVEICSFYFNSYTPLILLKRLISLYSIFIRT